MKKPLYKAPQFSQLLCFTMYHTFICTQDCNCFHHNICSFQINYWITSLFFLASLELKVWYVWIVCQFTFCWLLHSESVWWSDSIRRDTSRKMVGWIKYSYICWEGHTRRLKGIACALHFIDIVKIIKKCTSFSSKTCLNPLK